MLQAGAISLKPKGQNYSLYVFEIAQVKKLCMVDLTLIPYFTLLSIHASVRGFVDKKLRKRKPMYIHKEIIILLELKIR